MLSSGVDVPIELLDVIGQVENKLYERGMIVSLCGNEEAECSLFFLSRDDEGVYLQVKVSSLEDTGVNEEIAERISNFVLSKLYEAFEGGSFDIESDFMGVEVLVNNKLVY